MFFFNHDYHINLLNWPEEWGHKLAMAESRISPPKSHAEKQTSLTTSQAQEEDSPILHRISGNMLGSYLTPTAR